MNVYAINVISLDDQYSTTSQEGYSTLEKAQAFCEGRSGNIKKVNEYTYREIQYRIGYKIVEIKIV